MSDISGVQGSSAGVGGGVNLKDEKEVKDYLDNLGVEYRFGCYHERSPASCHLLGDYLEGIKKDFAKAFRIYQTNCDEHNHGHSCHKVGGYRYIGKACSKDPDLAYDYFRKACDSGYYTSCLNVGLLDSAAMGSRGYERKSPPDPSVARDSYKKACDYGDVNGGQAESCHRYASMFIKGTKGACEKNMEEAFKYSLKACELGNMAGCVNVSMMYAKGEGTEKNPVVAKEYGDIASEMMAQFRQEQARQKFQQEM